WAGLDPTNGDPMGYLDGQVSKNYSAIIQNTPIDSLVFAGSARPTVFGSIRNSFSYGKFGVSLLISGKFGYYYRRYTTGIDYPTALSNTGINIDYEDRWQQPGDETRTTVPSVVYPSNSNRNNFYRYAETLIEKADHIRLQDIQFTYSLKKGQLWFTVNNIGIIWRANKHGIDPDYNGSNFSASYPNPRQYTIGYRTSF
ncbi:MAG TPA: hypothetical protein VG842_00885, partial [Sediminibacterium sp.]|nr:hypothetical protein [Sediminibacterium sp.]